MVLTNASAAAAGTVGEVISETLGSGSAVSLVNSSATNVTFDQFDCRRLGCSCDKSHCTINSTTSALVTALTQRVDTSKCSFD